MVAIVAGAGLGLLDTSAYQRNGAGVIGDGYLGHNNGNATVNAANGNLVLQFTDETLAGSGADLYLQRSYNSQGNATGQDHWRWMGERRIDFVRGSPGQEGSAVRRISADGHEAIYEWDSSKGAYVSSVGDGSEDRITYFVDEGFTWIEGTTQAREVYNPLTGWIAWSADRSGNGFTYTFDGDHLAQVEDSRTGQAIKFLRNAEGRVWQVQTIEAGNSTPTKQANYVYDSLGRLKEVISDLTLDNTIFGETSTYKTVYTYEGNSLRISSISQSDGTFASYTYVNVNGDYKVETVSDKYGTTRFDYSVVNGQDQTQVTNAEGDVTLYVFDDQKRLKIIDRGDEEIIYEYDARDNVLSVTQGRNSIDLAAEKFFFVYDDNDNLISASNLEGGVREYSYTPADFDRNNMPNLVRTETVWNNGEPQTTRYTYDDRGRLSFTISAEGRVSRNIYNSFGQITQTIDYVENKYDVSSVPDTLAISEEDLLRWDYFDVDKSKIQLTDYQYNHLGQLEREINYGSVDAEGQGILDASVTQTEYVHSAYGELLQTISVTGNNRDTKTVLTSQVYDGLGRIISQASQSGTSTTSYHLETPAAGGGVSYDFQKIQVVNSNGVTVTEAYDQRGRLVAVTQSGATQTRETRYYYDAAGRLRMTQDPEGGKQYTFYDDNGRVSHQVSELGAVTQYRYSEQGRLESEIRHSELVDTSTWFNGSEVIQGSLSIVTGSNSDRIIKHSYDAAGRRIVTREFVGNDPLEDRITTFDYDSASQLLASTVGNANLAVSNSGTDDDRVTRYFYDLDGRQMGTVNAESYLTENIYDAAGRLTATIRYGDKVSDLSSLVAAKNSISGSESLSTHYFYDAQGRQVGVVNEQGFLTQTVFDIASRSTSTIQFMTPVTVSDGDTLEQIISRAGTDIRTTTQVADGFGRLVSATSHDGTRTQYEYNSVGRLIRTVYAAGTSEETTSRIRYNAFGDATGEVSGVFDGLIANKGQAIDQYGTSYTYDLLGRKIYEKGSQGQKTFYYYDQESRLVYTVNALGEVTETTYNTYGEVATNRAFAGRISINGLTGGDVNSDIENRVNVIKNDALDERTSYRYNELGLLQSATDALGRTTTYAYNKFGDLTDTFTPHHTSLADSSRVQQRFVYDKLGRAVASHADYTGINAEVNTEYDGFGRVIRVNDANGNNATTDYRHQGRTIIQKDALFRETASTYDALGRVLEVVNANGDAVQYVYNDTDRTTAVTSPEGITRTTWQTRLGQTLQTQDGNGGITRYTYDKSGNLKTLTDTLGNVTTHFYDSANRHLSTQDANGNWQSVSYDAANRRKLSITDGAGANIRTSYSYDGIGRAVQERKSFGVQEQRTNFIYDSLGRLQQEIIDPDGLKLSTRYTYDRAGNQNKVERGTVADPSQQITKYEFDNLGRRTKEILDPGGLNITTEYEYDKNGNVTKIIHPKSSNPVYAGSSPITWYFYNGANERTHEVDARRHLTTFEYDRLGNLSQTRQYVNHVTEVVPGSNPNRPVGFVAKTNEDRRAYTIRDDDGRERFTLTKVDDDQWVVTENVLDGNGNIIESRRFDQYLSDLRVTAITSVISRATPESDQGKVITEDEIIAELQSLGYHALNWGESVDNLFSTRRTHFTFDASNRLRFTVDANGYLSENVYDNVGNVRFQNRYATNYLEGKPTYGSGVTEVFTEAFIEANKQNSINDRTTEFRYDGANRLQYELTSRATIQASNGIIYDGRIKKRIYYDTLSQVTRIDEGIIDLGAEGDIYINSRTTTYAYDKAGRQTNTWLTGWYDTTDNRVYRDKNGEADRLQRSVEVTYDALGNAVRNDVKLGNSIYSTQYIVYDAIDRELYNVDGEGYVSGKTYDGAGNVLTETRYAVSIHNRGYANWSGTLSQANMHDALSSSGQRTITHQYDLLNNKVRTILPSVSSNHLSSGISSDNIGSLQSYTASPETLYFYNAFNEVYLERVKIDASRSADTYQYYDNIGRKTLNVDAERYGTFNEYNALGDVIRVTEYASRANGSHPDFVFDAVMSNAAQDPRSNTPDYGSSFESYNFSVDRKNNFTYDNKGQVVSDVSTRENTYNAFGEITASQNRANEVTRYEYDRLGRVTKTIAPSTRVARFADTHFSNTLEVTPITEMTYDVFGNVLFERRLSNHHKGNLVVEEQHYYDHVGNHLSYKDGRGFSTYFRFDVNGNVIREWRAASVSGPTSSLHYNHAIQKDYEYDRVGRRIVELEVFDGKKSGTRHVYNAFGEVSSEEKLWGSAISATEDLTARTAKSYTYDNAGRVIITNGVEGHTFFYYDLTGNVTRQEHKGTNVHLGQTRVTENNYDRLGRVLITRTPSFRVSSDSSSQLLNPKVIRSYDRWGNVTRLQNEAGAVSTFQYNRFNQVVEEIGPVQTAYLQFSTGLDNVDRKQTRVQKYYSYDSEGQLEKEEERVYFRLSDGSWGLSYDVRLRTYTYDTAGNLTQTVDATGVEQTFIYDFHGNRAASRDGLGNTLVYLYDKNHNLVQQGYLDSGVYTRLKSLRYDHANRLYAEDNRGRADIFYKFDSRGNIVEKIEAAGKHSRYTFDDLGYKIKDEVNVGGWQTISETRYDVDGLKFGQASYRIAANGNRINLSYTNFGEIYREDNVNSDSYIEYRYLDNGLLSQKTDNDRDIYGLLANGQLAYNDSSISTRYEYNISGQRTKETVQISSAREAQNGQLLGLDHSGINITNYNYDELGRLVYVSSPGDSIYHEGEEHRRPALNSLFYDHDAWGNRVRVRSNYRLADSLHNSGRSRHFSYDLEGRVLVAEGVLRPYGSPVGNVTILVPALAPEEGVAYTYDRAGNKATETTMFETRRRVDTGNSYGGPVYETVTSLDIKRFQYNEIGQLTTVYAKKDSGPESVYATHKYDVNGFKTESIIEGKKTVNVYDIRGRITSVTTYKSSGVIDTKTDAYNYEADGNVKSYRFRAFDGSEHNVEVENTYKNFYEMTFTGRQASRIEVNSSQDRTEIGTTVNEYDHRGRLIKSEITESNTSGSGSGISKKLFFYNSDDQIVVRSYKHFQENDFDVQTFFYHQGQSLANLGVDGVNLTPIETEYLAGNTHGTYTVLGGETLADVAQSIYGDSSLWYVIADTNALTQGPADRFSSQEAGRSLRIPANDQQLRNNSTTFQPYNPTEVIGDLTPDPTILPPPKKSCNPIAIIIIVVVAVVLTVVTAGAAAAAIGAAVPALAGTTAAAVGGAFVGGVVGSLGSQVAGVALGVSDGINLRQAFASGLTGAFTAGIGAALSSSGSVFATQGVLNTAGKVVQGASSVIAGSVANKIAGLDSGFSWRAVAAGAVSGGLSIGDSTGIKGISDSSFIEGFSNAAVSSVARKAAGLDQGRSDGEILADAFGNGLASSLSANFKLYERGRDIGNRLSGKATDGEVARLEAFQGQVADQMQQEIENRITTDLLVKSAAIQDAISTKQLDGVIDSNASAQRQRLAAEHRGGLDRRLAGLEATGREFDQGLSTLLYNENQIKNSGLEVGFGDDLTSDHPIVDGFLGTELIAGTGDSFDLAGAANGFVNLVNAPRDLALTLAASVAGETLGGLSGLLSLTFTDAAGANNNLNSVQSFFSSLPPDNPLVNELFGGLSSILSPASEGFFALSQGLGDSVFELTGSAALATLAYSAPTAILEIFGGAVVGKLARIGKNVPDNAYMRGKFVGTVDESFTGLSLDQQIGVSFSRIEGAFGSSYATRTRELFDSVRLQNFNHSSDLGMFSVSGKSPSIHLNNQIGNADVMALTILHETRHLRQFNKVSDSLNLSTPTSSYGKVLNHYRARDAWNNNLTTQQKEVFATSTNVWQANRLGLSAEDTKIFSDYYDFWRN